MKCPNCEAENPDYAFYCGKCAKELRPSSPPPRARPIEVERPSALEVAINPFKSPQLTHAKEVREALEEELRARGIKVPIWVKVFSVSVAALVVLGAFIVGISLASSLPWLDKLLPSYMLAVGFLLIVTGLALLVLVLWLRSKRIAP